MGRTVSSVRSAGSWLGFLVVAVLIVVASPAQIAAQEHEQHEATGEPAEASAEHEEAGEGHEGSEEHGEEHEFHKHHFAVILSSTESPEEHGEEHNGDGHGDTHSEGSSGGKDDPDFTIGFDYERRFTKLFGFGGMIDWVAEGRREFLTGPIALLHPFKGSKLWVAPLAERIRETHDWDLVWRIGAGWDFPVGKSGKYSIAPNINYDITEEHELWVLGVAFGMGF
jgi:hypothetical protein